MKNIWIVVVALFSLSLMIEAADARRLSGGKNVGMQRSAPAQQQAAPKGPAQQQQAAPATPAQQPQPAGASKWLGPLAGLAIGAALGAFFFSNGMTGLLSGLLLIGLLAAAAVFAARFFMRGRVAQAPLQYAGAGASEQSAGAGAAERSVAALPGGAGSHSVAATTGPTPPEFDTAGFIRQARLNFVRLQEAHDRKDLSTMREFLAPDVYREIEAEISAAGEAMHQTEVVTLEAEVLEVAEEAGSYIVSVRFSGLLREAADREAEPFTETWHLEKPISGRGGWLVAGIQQA